MTGYGKFRPIKNGKHRKPKPRYITFKTGEQGWKIARPSWDPSTRQLKALALVFVVIAGVLGADQIAKVLLPNSPLNPLQNYDPFTLLWNGTATAASSSAPTLSSIISQTSGGTAQGLGAGVTVTTPVWFGECWKAPISSFLYKFNVSMKKVGSPTGTISGGLLDPGGNPRNCDSAFSPFTATSSNSFDASTLSTSFSQVTFDFSSSPYRLTSGNFYDINIQWNGCGACDTSNYVTIEIAATGITTQNGIISANGKTFNDCANPVAGPGSDAHCPGTYDLKFNVFGGGPCPAGYACSNSKIDISNRITLNANSTFPGVALTKAPIDVSTSSAKELFFYETWANSTNLSVAQPWGWYLTTNSTLPTQKGYFPLNDTNVVLANLVYPNAGDTSKNYYEYMAKTGASQSLLATSGQAANPYPSCPQTSTIYICSGGRTASGSAFLSISTTLNYTGNAGNTGNNGFSLLCNDGTPSTGPPTSNYCSSVSSVNTLTPCSAEFCATPTLPFLNMQSGPFYLGFWSSAGQTATLQFGTANTGVASARANSIWYWVPNPTVATPATVEVGGFFGPVIKALLGIGVWIVANIVSFIVFLSSVIAPFLAATLSVLVGVLQAELNALGVFFGWGNIGDQFISFASGVITYFTTGLSDALLWLVRLISRGIDLIKIANFWVGFYLTGVLNVLADALNVIQFIVRIGTTITTFLGSSYVLIMVIFFLWYDADMGIAGWHAWFETVKWITFISFDFLERMINFGISSVTWIIGRIPTFDGTTLPELPTIAIGGGPIWPSMDMTSLREGNVFALFGQLIGVVFLVWFESSGLPGSIGANVPNSVAGNMAPFVTPLLIFVAIMGLVFVVSIPANLVRGTFGLDSLPSSVVGRARAGIISSGQGVSGRVVRKDKKFKIQVNRGLGAAGLRPHLRKPQPKYTATVGPNIN